MGTTVSIPGSGRVDVTVYGNGTVMAGNGTDNINITGLGQIVVGSGSDTLTLGQGGSITQYGVTGHDTIQIGNTGTYTINEQGSATVSGAFGQATISGGTVQIVEAPGQAPMEIVTAGHVTVIGAGSTAAGSGSTHTQGGSGHDTLTGSGSHNPFDFLKQEKGGQHVIHNFVSGVNHLVVEGHTLNYMLAKNEIINMHADQTMIHMDGGKTTIALHGVNISDIKH